MKLLSRVETNFDPREYAIHNRVAAMRFPGPNYYEVLRWLHEDLRPETYLEIGVWRGHTLMLAMPPTIALGIDPFPEVDDCWKTQTTVLPMTSSNFFARHTLREFLGTDGFSLAFVDGSHRFEQVIDDIFNLENYAEPKSVIAVHDTLPLDERTAARERSTQFYTGDVWKVIPFLKQCRPDLQCITVRTGPSGLTLIQRLNPCRTRTAAEVQAVDEFKNLTWEFYKRRQGDFLETIPNNRAAVAAWPLN